MRACFLAEAILTGMEILKLLAEAILTGMEMLKLQILTTCFFFKWFLII